MAFYVSVLDEPGYGLLTRGRATDLCAAAFELVGLDLDLLGEVSVALVKSDVIKELNKEFRGIEAPTDVLSFDLDGPYGEMAGEILLAPECVASGMTVDELVVHGALHLGGMDHGEDFEASEMARLQGAVMEKVRG